MVGELRYRKDLYRGTAADYDRFRPPYPAALLDDLRARVPLGRDARVLDLACGTGQIAFALAADVAEVWAVDQEAGSVAFGRRKAGRLAIGNIRWVAAAAESLPLPVPLSLSDSVSVSVGGRFDLVAIGNAFHRVDRDIVARRLVPRLSSGGCVALLWSGTPWLGDLPWQRVLDETIARWRDAVGAHDRVPAGWEEVISKDPHAQVLQRAGFTYEGSFSFGGPWRWDVESLVGFVYSTSFLSRAVLGDRAADFARDLEARLLACRPDGVFSQDLPFGYELARL